MKSLILLIFGLFLAGCASTDTEVQTNPPEVPEAPEVPLNDPHTQVRQADHEWEMFTDIEQPPQKHAAAVQEARTAYRKAGTNYVTLVNELMIPPLGVSPKRKQPP